MNRAAKTLASAEEIRTDRSWQKIVEELFDTSEGLSELAMQIVEYAVCGYSKTKACKQLGITVYEWNKTVKDNPAIAQLITDGLSLARKWRTAQLEEQYMDAINKSKEILQLSLSDDTVNVKLVGTIAQHARYVIDLFARNDLAPVASANADTDMALKASKDALDYLVEKIASSTDDEIIVTHRIVDADSAPKMKSDASPNFGELGVLEYDDDGKIRCHVCGVYAKNFVMHIRRAHSLEPMDYEAAYDLPEGEVRRMVDELKGEEDD